MRFLIAVAGRETGTGDGKEWRGFYDFPARRSSSPDRGQTINRMERESCFIGGEPVDAAGKRPSPPV